jgi:hypothetical protein
VDELWLKFYWRLDTKLSAAVSVNVVSFYDSASVQAVQLQMYLDGTTPQLYVRYKNADTPAYTNGTAQNIAEDTWYRITLRYKKNSGAADGIVYFRLDSTVVTNVTTNEATGTIVRTYLGTAGAHTATWKSYYDNLWWDDDSEPADCAN